MLRTMSTTSSRTPGIEENSCSTLSILIDVTAAPCSDDSSTRRSALPSVRPKPPRSGPPTPRACPPEAALERLGDERHSTAGIDAGFGDELLRLDEILPVLLQHGGYLSRPVVH